MKKLPNPIRQDILKRVYELADSEGYLTNNRVNNSMFLERLVDNEDVGLVLQDFMEKDRVRVYIKDSLLNKYAKDRRAVNQYNLTTKIAHLCNESVCMLSSQNDVMMFRAESTGSHIVVAKGSYMKWETALRKVLLYIAATPQLKQQNNQLIKAIVITTGGVPIPTGEEEALRSALSEINVGLVAI
ncbi:hypothetical protein MJ257_02360 [Paenibacillus timonensis]|uniref:LUD domain-containing protein n=1 Tax=Paenibacillus timonensis TaxID=225915 RepID=A0ABW3S710_9BACL|nr:hypothetical protein [Paenibacillus timonensis]MCH1638937.1 hypothetical protein [Paenibacillus timonensis]